MGCGLPWFIGVIYSLKLRLHLFWIHKKDFGPSKYFIESHTTDSIGLFYKRDTSKFYSVSSNVINEKIMRLTFQCNFVFLLCHNYYTFIKLHEIKMKMIKKNQVAKSSAVGSSAPELWNTTCRVPICTVKPGKMGRHCSSQGKVWEFWTDWKSPKSQGKSHKILENSRNLR